MRRASIDPVISTEPKAPVRACDHPGCREAGDFRAPMSRDELHRYYWFCLAHVRAYNLSWNYYAGMSEGEIESEIRNDTMWQRPTWKLGQRHGPDYAARMRDPFDLYRAGMNGSSERRSKRDGRADAQAERILSEQEQALAVFEVEPPITAPMLKARYKVLVKQHHPDAHGGDKAAEERLKIINQAYATLKAAYFG